MNRKFAVVALTTATLSLAPLSPAYADGWGHHGGGHGGGWEHEGWGRGGHHGDHDFELFTGLAIAGAAVTGAAAAIVTAPFRVLDDAVAPAPVYASPAPDYYQGGYYAPAYPQQRVVVYSYPQPYPYAYGPYGYPVR